MVDRDRCGSGGNNGARYVSPALGRAVLNDDAGAGSRSVARTLGQY